MRRILAVTVLAAGVLSLGGNAAWADDTLYDTTTEVDVSANGQPVFDATAVVRWEREGDTWVMQNDVVFDVGGEGDTHTFASPEIYCAGGSITAATLCTVLDALADLT